MKSIFKIFLVLGLVAVLAVIPAQAQDSGSVTLTLAGYTRHSGNLREDHPAL